MGSGGNPIFNEVLQVSIDVDQFVNGLKQLEDAYDAFVERVNAKGFGASNVLGVGAFASVSETLNQLSENFTSFDAALTQSADSLQSVFSKAAQGIEAMSQRIVDSEANVAKGAAEAKDAVEGLSKVPTTGGTGATITPQVTSEVTGQVEKAAGFSEAFAANLSLSGESLGKMLGTLVSVNILWTAINLAVEAVTAAIEAPFKFIAAGVQYTSDLQDKSADLQGVILQTVKLSDDFGENFKKAGEQATIIAKQLEDISIKTGIASDQLQRAYKGVLDSGGAQLTGGLQGAVELTEQFAILMRGAGVSADGTRRIIAEIPKALEGTLPPSSQLLKTLGETPDQFKAMVAEAKEFGNLQELLAEKVKPFVSVLDQAETRMSVLRNELSLILERVAGGAAAPLFAEMISALQTIKQYYLDHKELIENIANTFGALVKAVYDMVSALLVNTGTWKAILGTVLAISEVITLLINGVTTLTNVMADFVKTLFSSQSWDTFLEHTDASFKKYIQQWSDGAKRLAGDISGSFDSAQGPQAEQGQAIRGPRDLDAAKEGLAALKKLREDYNSDLKLTSEFYRANRDTIQEEVSAGTLSHHDAHLKTMQDLEDQKAVVQQLTDKFIQLAQATGAKPAAIASFTEKIEEANRATQAAATHAQSKDSQSDNKYELEIAQAHAKALEALESEHSRAMLAIYKEEAAQGLHSKVDVFDQEQAAAQKDYDIQTGILYDELNRVGEDDKKKQQISDQLAKADQTYTDSVQKNALLRIALVHSEAQALAQSEVKQQQDLLSLATAKAQGDDQHHQTATAIQEQNEALAEQAVAVARLNVGFAEQAKIIADASKDLKAQVDAENALVSAKTNLQTAENHLDVARNAPIEATKLPDLLKKAFEDGRDGLKSAFDNFKDSVQTLAQALTQGLGDINGAISTVKSGYSQGGVLGAVGSGATLAASYDPEPISKAILQIGGGLLSFFGSIFTAEAKKIADTISKQIATTMQDYQNQSINLIQAIGQLQAERADAIAKLSGVKGGQDQLNKLLPQLDQQIAALKLQQTQVLTTFQDQLAVLNEHSQILGQALQTWQNINKQVKDYLGAGGDAAKAAQYLSDNLQQLEASTQASLDSAEATAITDAISLNDLLTQKVQLQKDYNAQLFAARNADAIERSVAPAILIAQTTNAQTLAYNQQLASLNNQIDLATRKVDLEKTVFNIAADTATLQARSNDLAIAALNTQIQQYKDMQKIIASIYQNSSGFYLGGGYSSPGQSAPIIVNIGSISGAGGGTGIGNEIANTLAQRTRYGLTPSFSTR